MKLGQTSCTVDHDTDMCVIFLQVVFYNICFFFLSFILLIVYDKLVIVSSCEPQGGVCVLLCVLSQLWPVGVMVDPEI